MASTTSSSRRFDGGDRAALVIGIALSGFFDGILLHQVLQWHHLLSLVPGDTFRDLRTQVYFDGLFHVLIYAVAALGLAMLFRARHGLDRPGSGRRLAGAMLIGFGVWNLIDVGFFHWILAIHRIRVDVPNPMAYDLAWLVGLGLVPAAAGWFIRRGGAGSGGGRRTATALTILLLLAAPVANLPVAGGQTLVVFRPDLSLAHAVTAIAAVGGRIAMIDPDGRFAVVAVERPGASLALYRSGALLVSRSPGLAGCLAATRFIRQT